MAEQPFCTVEVGIIVDTDGNAAVFDAGEDSADDIAQQREVNGLPSALYYIEIQVPIPAPVRGVSRIEPGSSGPLRVVLK